MKQIVPSGGALVPAEVVAPVGASTSVGVDEYRVRVWPSRRWGVVGAWGWRAQVDHVSRWGEHGDVPVFSGSGTWLPSQDEAVDWAVAEVRELHAGEGCCWCAELGAPRGLPLVVHAGGVVVVDERAARPGEARTGGEVR